MTTTIDPPVTIDTAELELQLYRAAQEGINSNAAFRALLHLHREGAASLSAIALASGTSTANVTGMADRLTKAGLVRRDLTSPDRRIIRLELTFEGRNAMRRILTGERQAPTA